VRGVWFESRSYQTEDYKIGINCFFAKHGVLMSKNNDWLVCSEAETFVRVERHVYPRNVV